MIYRERGETDIYEEHLRDIVLRRHSAIGPWLVMGLGVALVLFLSYLVYSNVLLPSAAPLSRSSPPHPSAPAVTSVPQSRATHALPGGAGPALLPGRIAVRAHDTIDLGAGATAISH